MVYVMREGMFYKTPLGVVGERPVGFCPCCNEYSLFVADGGCAVWCLVCSGIKSSYSLTEDELEAYRAKLLALRAEEELVSREVHSGVY